MFVEDEENYKFIFSDCYDGEKLVKNLKLGIYFKLVCSVD